MQHGLFLPESTFSADSLTVSVQSPCAIAGINIGARVKNPDTGSHVCTPLVGHTKILHTLLGIGGAALAAAVAIIDLGEADPKFPARDQ